MVANHRDGGESSMVVTTLIGAIYLWLRENCVLVFMETFAG